MVLRGNVVPEVEERTLNPTISPSAIFFRHSHHQPLDLVFIAGEGRRPDCSAPDEMARAVVEGYLKAKKPQSGKGRATSAETGYQ